MEPPPAAPETGPGPVDQHGPAGPAGTSTHWAVEVLEVLTLRRRALLAVAVGVSLLGVLAALLAPGIVPPRPLVGASVGLAAALLAIAAALAIDSVDLVIRGPRHVRASGGRLAAVMIGQPDPQQVVPLVRRLRAADDQRLRLAFAPAGEAVDATEVAHAVARRLADLQRRVLLIDVSAAVPARGLVDVARGDASLVDVVSFDESAPIARVHGGRDQRGALLAVPQLASRLPSDIDVMLVILPALGVGGALHAAGALDRIMLVVEQDVTPRVQLIAGLDAVDGSEAACEVVLLRPDSGVAGPGHQDAAATSGASEAAAPSAVSTSAPEAGSAVTAPDDDAVDHPTQAPPTADHPTDSEPTHPATTPAPDTGDPAVTAVPPVPPPPVPVAPDATPTAGGRDAAVSPRSPDASDAPDAPDAPDASDASEPSGRPDALSDAPDAGDAPEAADAPAESAAEVLPGQVDATDPSIPPIAPAAPPPSAASQAAPPPTDAAAEPAPFSADETDQATSQDPEADAADPVTPAELDLDRSDPSTDPGRWAAPADVAHLGSHLPESSAEDDLPEDSLRAAAALQTLAQQVWERERDQA